MTNLYEAVQDPLVRWITFFLVVIVFLIVFRFTVRPLFQSRGKIDWATLWYRFGMLIKWFGSAGFKLYMLNAGMIFIEFFLGLRAGAIYHEFFAPTLGTELLFGIPYLLHLASVVAFLMVFVSGIYVATHQPKDGWGWASYITALVITLAHDWGGVLYNDIHLDFSHVNSQLVITIIITICFCGLPVLPIIFGRWLPDLKVQHGEEIQEWRNNWNIQITNKIQDRVMRRVEQQADLVPFEELGDALPEGVKEIGQGIISAYRRAQSRIVSAAPNGGLPSPAPRRTTILPSEEEYEEEESSQPPFVARKSPGLHLFRKRSS